YRSEMPALRFCDQKVAEHLNARDRLQFLRINEKRIERDAVGFAEQLDKAAVLLDQIIREQCNADAALAGPLDAEDVVDRQDRSPRAFAVAPRLHHPPPILEVVWYHSPSEQ